MTILTSTSQSIPKSPPWYTDDATKPVFHLRAGDVIERGLLEAELAEYRAGRVDQFDLYQSARAGLADLLAGDDGLDHLLNLLDVEAQGEIETLSAEDKATLRGARDILSEHYAPYRELLAQARRRQELAPILALRRFCTGIDAKDVEFKLDKGIVSQATLAQLGSLDLAWAGAVAFSMLYGGGQEKNLPQGSASDESPKPSQPDTSPAAGSSAKKPGKKTPATS